jgi:succinate dehydrogenase / fumarate reductase iron-sulfur subunit/fumarate reductase iron-sulfur subunit
MNAGTVQTARRDARRATGVAPAAGRERTIRVLVRRSADGADREFAVRAHDPVTVLDLLREIQRSHDPSLAFRYSCRVAMCGTCGVRVDGRSTLACRSVVAPGTERVEVAPLAGLPVVRDLIVDSRPFWDQWARVRPWFVPAEGDQERIAPGSPQAELVESALGCISWGACYSTCEVAQHRRDYLGPAALNRALALIADPRDGAAEERLRTIGGPGGVDRCHYVGGCTSACPVGLDPARSIVELRRLRLAGRP